jgi:hypothetical protein
MSNVIEKSYLDNLSKRLKRALDDNAASTNSVTRAKYLGYGNTKKIEPVPNFVRAECETIYKGENNTWITLGRDRPATLSSGYGGSGDSHAGAIDICVGRASRSARAVNETSLTTDDAIINSLLENGTVPDTLLQVHNDFKSDAARIYISQKTNIDDNFGIVPGLQGSAFPRSAIALKADLVRIVARENIKLVTRTDDENSQGGSITAVGGIDLIAGNDDSDLQPLVKGHNLVEVLEYMLEDIRILASTVFDLALAQQAYELVLTGHTHPIAPGGDPFTAPLIGAAPSVTVGIGTAAKSIKSLITSYPDLVITNINSLLEDLEYLKGFGGKHILSKKNNTN